MQIVSPVKLPLECCCFDGEAKTSLRDFPDRDDFKWEVYLYEIYSFIGSLITTLAFHCTLYLIQNEWSTALGKK